MSEVEPTSPRARICKWLVKTHNGLDQASAGESRRKAIPSKSEKRKRASPRSKRPAQPSQLLRLTKESIKGGHKLLGDSHHERDLPPSRERYVKLPFQVDRDETGERNNGSRPQECGNAQRLGLQEPFRCFGNEGAPILCDKGRPRKHQRRVLSSSSDLQPAILTNMTMDPQENRKSHALMVDRNSASLSHDSDHSLMLFSSPKQRVKSYERRPRHKTREGHYEIQQDKRGSKKKSTADAAEKIKPSDKRRKRMKSGGVLMHDFIAPNIPNDRLTLRPGRPSGIFYFGRASSPVKRKGLPDLTFSELAFLNTSRHEAKAPNDKLIKTDERRTKKAKKAMDAEAEISHYFIAHKTKDYDDRKAMREHRHTKKMHRSTTHESSSHIVDLPETPFLGFGTSGANSVSLVKLVKELDAKYVPAMSRRDTRSPSRASTYLSWSSSGAPLSISRSQEEPQQLLSDSKNLLTLTRDVKVSQKDELLESSPVRGDRAVARSAREDDIPTKRVLPDYGNSTEQSPIVDQVNANDAKGLERDPEMNALNSGERLHSNVDAPSTVMESAAEVSGNLAAEVISEAQQAFPVNPPRAETSISRKEYESLESTLKALLDVCKTKSSDHTGKDVRKVSQSVTEISSSKPTMQFDRIKEVENAAAMGGSEPSQAPNKDDQPAVTQDPNHEDHIAILPPFRREFGFPEMLPPAVSGDTVGRKDFALNPLAEQSPQLHIKTVREPAEKDQICMFGFNSLNDNYPDILLHGTRQTQSSRFAMDNSIDTEDSSRHPPLTSGLITTSCHVDNVDSALELPKDHSSPSSEKGDDHLAFDLAHDEFDFTMKDEHPRYHQPHPDNHDSNHQARRHLPFSVQSDRRSYLNIHSNDSAQQHSFFGHSYSRASQNAEYEYLGEVDRPKSRRSHPVSTQSHTDFSFASAQPLNFARHDHDRRLGGDVDVDLAGFWKPNKLY